MDIIEVMRRAALVVFLTGWTIFVVLVLALISRAAGPDPLSALFQRRNRTLLRAGVCAGIAACLGLLVMFGVSWSSFRGPGEFSSDCRNAQRAVNDDPNNAVFLYWLANCAE